VIAPQDINLPHSFKYVSINLKETSPLSMMNLVLNGRRIKNENSSQMLEDIARQLAENISLLDFVLRNTDGGTKKIAPYHAYRH
jgi:hypothetical protein